MKKLALISDVHGCYKTLMALVARIPKDHEIILLGDMIDRGPDSKGVIEWAMKNNIRAVCGNHDDMLIDHCIKGGAYSDGVWEMNGGVQCLKSFGGYIPEPVVKWFLNLPLYIVEDDLLLSHTGFATIGDNGNFHRISQLWHRDHKQLPKDKYFRVFGHTPNKKAVITERWANIDTGAAYSKYGCGNMTAMLWPSKELIVQEYVG